MGDMLAHRGPDGAGIYEDDLCSLGHRRLHITDTATCRQPLANETEDAWIVFDGEIYNHGDLRRELEALGHEFRAADSDAETIIHAYEEWGTQCPQRLRGQFAFAIWDARDQRLFLARDRFGIKPLYYARIGDRLLFASETKSLLTCPEVPRRLDYEALDQYLTFRYIPSPLTALQDIKSVRPAEWLLWERGKLTTDRYWRLRWEGPRQPVRSQEAAERVLELLEEAVRLRSMSAGPLGIYLSGGLDSTFITATAQRISTQPVHTFSIVFPGQRHDESSYSRCAAEQLRTEHHEIALDPSSTLQVLGQVAWHLDQPIADAAPRNIYLMAKATKPFASVVLSGTGGDEVFGGFKKYRIFSLVNYFRFLGGVPGLERLAPEGRLRRALRLWTSLRDPARAYTALYGCFTPSQKRRLYLGPLAEIWDRDERSAAVCAPFLNDHDTPFFHRIMAFDLHSLTPDNLLVAADRAGMACGVAGRMPYLDHELVEGVFQLPPQLKICAWRNKIIMRRAQRGIVPEAIRRRRKAGFSNPLQSWFQNSSPEERWRVMDLDALAEMEVWDIDEVKRLLSGKPNWYLQWQASILLSLSLWWRHALRAV